MVECLCSGGALDGATHNDEDFSHGTLYELRNTIQYPEHHHSMNRFGY